MAFDPSVLSQIGSTVDIPGAIGRGMQLKDLANTQQLNQLRVNEVKQQQSDEAKAREIFKTAKYDTQNGVYETMERLNKEGLRKQALEFGSMAQKYQSGEIEKENQILERDAAEHDVIAGSLDSVMGRLNELKERGATPAELDAAAASFAMPEMNRLAAQYKDNPRILERIRGFAGDPKNLSYQGIDAAERQSNKGQQLLKERLAERKQGETERENSARDDRGERALGLQQKKENTPKVPVGFERDPENPDSLRPVKGGPKDPNSKPWSGREKVFSERILTSANEAGRAIKNITELPIGASSGTFGLGASPGSGLLSSAKGALTNKMAPQEVQDYNTMLAGVKRNLATIESVGLAPSGALTEGFSSLELREGDSNLTKLRKLAEMRQIIDAGLEVQQADPAIPDTIKNLMTKVRDTVSKAVPYTQSDVTKLQREQQKNPDTTLGQLINQQGLGGSGSAKPYADAEKEKRYQEWKKSHGQ